MRRSGVRPPSAPPITHASAIIYKHNLNLVQIANWPSAVELTEDWNLSTVSKAWKVLDVASIVAKLGSLSFRSLYPNGLPVEKIEIETYRGSEWFSE